MKKMTFSLLCLFIFSASSTFAQATATLSQTASSSQAVVNQCVEKGLKCCNKARGKRAEKIRSKCEKKYKCLCPVVAPKA